MKRDPIDFFVVADPQLDIHARLENWARYVQPKQWTPEQGPVWRLGKSNTRQWEMPAPRTNVDPLDGHKIERAVHALPDKHCAAIRWAYVHRTVWPTKMRRKLGVTDDGLMELIVEGRQMLINRKV